MESNERASPFVSAGKEIQVRNLLKEERGTDGLLIEPRSQSENNSAEMITRETL